MQSADYCFLLSLLRLADLWRFTYVPWWSCKINPQNMRDAVFLSNLSVCRVPGHFRPDNIHHKTRTCSITWSAYTCQLLNYLAPCYMLDTLKSKTIVAEWCKSQHILPWKNQQTLNYDSAITTCEKSKMMKVGPSEIVHRNMRFVIIDRPTRSNVKQYI